MFGPILMGKGGPEWSEIVKTVKILGVSMPFSSKTLFFNPLFSENHCFLDPEVACNPHGKSQKC